MNHPAISVVMPVYNGEKYLEEAIKSLQSQTFGDFELLAVDDFSTDGSREILEKYAASDVRIKILGNELGKGLAGALNTGLAHAKSKYIARADADDLNFSDRFERQFRYMENHPRIYLLGAWYSIMFPNGRRKTIRHPVNSLLLGWKFLSNSYVCHPCVMFRREAAAEAGGYPAEEAEDFAFFSKVVRNRRAANLPRVLLNYRSHGENRSEIRQKQIFENARSIAKANFIFYAVREDLADKFFLFQVKYWLPLRDTAKIICVSFAILGKISRRYGIQRLSAEYASASAGVIKHCLLAAGWTAFCKISGRSGRGI